MRTDAHRTARSLVLGLAAAAALTACSGTPSPTPTPGPVPQIAVTPGLEPRLRGWLEEFSNAFGPPGFDLVVLPIQVAIPRVQGGEAALAISVAEPPTKWFVTPLGREGIVFVTPSSNPLTTLSLQALADILAGRSARWDPLGGPTAAIQPIIPLPGDDLRVWIEARLLPGSPAASNSRLADSPEHSAAWVRVDPAAIGYVPMAMDLNGLRALAVDGIAATPSTVAGGRYPFVVDILAYAPSEPSGAVRSFLAWIQANKLQH
jgi:hypothetical protein